MKTKDKTVELDQLIAKNQREGIKKLIQKSSKKLTSKQRKNANNYN